MRICLYYDIAYVREPCAELDDQFVRHNDLRRNVHFRGPAGDDRARFVLGILLSAVYRNTVDANLTPLLLALVPELLGASGQYTTLVVALIQQLFVIFMLYSALVLLTSLLGRLGSGGVFARG